MSAVKQFEEAFSSYVGAKHGIAVANGMCSLHVALVAIGVRPGDRVATTPLTMSSTSIAILHAGAVPVFVDVDSDTWLMSRTTAADPGLGVSLYGLCAPDTRGWWIDDAAQTLRQHAGAAFTSFSFQASKILPLGEGGMLVTNSEELATRAREFSSLGYRMPNGPVIDKRALKHPSYERHHSLGYNFRMSTLVAERGLQAFKDNGPDFVREIDMLKQVRLDCAALYRDVVRDVDWLTPQHVPDGWTHDYWTYAVATDTPERLLWLLDAVERHGGERPYPAWLPMYLEPAFAAPFGMNVGTCPVAESLQPRLAQLQTNSLVSARKNANALRSAIEEAI